jgi:hypothetical protein
MGKRNKGYALYFIDDEPPPGPKRLRMTYTYGHNIDANILGQYATLHAGVLTLLAAMGSNSPTGLRGMQTGNLGSFVSTNYNDRIVQYRTEMARIEILHFPTPEEDDDPAVGVL